MRRKHLYHILTPSPWPLFSSLFSFFTISAVAFYMNGVSYSGEYFFVSFFFFFISVTLWVDEIVNESTKGGYHTETVKVLIVSGYILFLASEVMLFFAFFWSFCHFAFAPSCELGSEWPPVGIHAIMAKDAPLFNTALLLTSGLTISYTHCQIILRNYKSACDGYIWTIFLGVLFLIVQFFEYYEAAYDLSDGSYASAFFFLTGLHGLHVLIGVLYICVSFYKYTHRHYYEFNFKSFVMANWYWHFVDAIWLALYVIVYLWGNW